ncbi:MAG TPA: OB-fold domain-containing protein, partial [Candidatus Paceibacterota bacterium]|nr:OB-fold domain-containing protein [Candidatus Paceibacterota bacterium]
MIGQLTGIPIYKGDRFAIIDVHGVGYQAFLTADHLVKIRPDQPETLKIWTYLAVREDALDLYGFETRIELDYFQLLISISGVGPKSALG